MTEGDFTATKHLLKRLKEREIKEDWITQTLKNPIQTTPDQEDPSLTIAYKPISEYEDRR